jgi:hypothetical protein
MGLQTVGDLPHADTGKNMQIHAYTGYIMARTGRLVMILTASGPIDAE